MGAGKPTQKFGLNFQSKALGEGMKAVKTDSPMSQLGLTHPNRTFRTFFKNAPPPHQIYIRSPAF